jgi:hypothetical protein
VPSAHGTRPEVSSDTWSKESGVVKKYNGGWPRNNRTYLVIVREPIETAIVEHTVWEISGITVDDRIIADPRTHKKDSNGGSSASNKYEAS